MDEPGGHEADAAKAEQGPICHVVGRRELGPAWAGNTANTSIFRHHAVLTRDRQQYVAYYENRNTLVLDRRNLDSGEGSQFRIYGDFTVEDAHNVISIGLDGAGILHVCYDQHGGSVRYRRGREPHSIAGFTEEIPLTGAFEDRVTYPTFLSSPHLSRLLFLYRDGKYNRGTARLKTYDETEQVWADSPDPILSGALHRPWTSNAYWNHPVIGPDGILHLSFVWRTDPVGGPLGLINNINVGYARSPDMGRSWQTSRGVPLRLPMTQVNAETVWAVPPASNLMNQCSMALDHRNNPHIVYYANDENGIVQYQHLWFDGKKWRNDVVSRRRTPFTLQGGGTLQVPLSRPEILMDRDGHAFIFFRSAETGRGLAVTGLRSPEYAYHPDNTRIVLDEDLGWSEPILDRERWREENVASFYVQYCDQPDGDVNPSDRQALACLYDLTLGFA